MLPDPHENYYDVYIAGALTPLGREHTSRKRMYEDVAQVCLDLGLKPYVPHKRTDPIEHPEKCPREVYTIDTERVRQARLIIAFADVPSFGVGTELEVAHTYGRHAILMIRMGSSVSRMVLGNPCVRGQVAFSEATWQKSLRLLRLEIVRLAGLLSNYQAVPSSEEEGTGELKTGYLEVHLPIKYNDGQPVPEELFTEFEDLLRRRFGGSWHHSGAGDWTDKEGAVFKDENRIYRVFVADDAFSQAELDQLKKTLQIKFMQLEIFVTWTPAKRL